MNVREVILNTSTSLAQLEELLQNNAAGLLLIATAQQGFAAVCEHLRERKIIEQAKGVLMKRTGLTEQESHQRLQKKAISQGRKVLEIANAVMAAELIFVDGELPKNGDSA